MKKWLIEDSDSHAELIDYMSSVSHPFDILDKFTSVKLSFGSTESLNKNPDDYQTVVATLGSMKWLVKNGWKDKVWFDDGFLTENYKDKLKPFMLNKNSKAVRVDELLDQMTIETIWDELGSSGAVFSRPDRGDKPFTGAVCIKKNYFSDSKYIQSRCKPEDLVIFSEPKKIDIEYRSFIVKGKCIAGSTYRVNGELEFNEGCPDNVKEFVENVHKVWNPWYPAYVMDVAVCDGELLVVEPNSFSSSGFYESSLKDIVNSIDNI